MPLGQLLQEHSSLRCEGELVQQCFFLHPDFLLGQTDFGLGGWKSSMRRPLGEQSKLKCGVVDTSEGASVQVWVLSWYWQWLCNSCEVTSVSLQGFVHTTCVHGRTKVQRCATSDTERQNKRSNLCVGPSAGSNTRQHSGVRRQSRVGSFFVRATNAVPLQVGHSKSALLITVQFSGG